MPQNKINFHHLIITGFMGTGKTTISALLAKQSNRPFLDTDRWIEAQSTLSINQIFAQYGESSFRQWEYKTAVMLLELPPSIIATGGGFFLNDEIRSLLTHTNQIITLTATPQTITQRLQKDSSRPLLAPDNTISKIKQLLLEREDIYTQFDSIPTDNHTPMEIATIIYQRFLHDRI